MILEFKLPPIGEGVDSADIAEILISPGETITAESVVMELETDKAVIELTCPHVGIVKELAVSEGETITVGQTLFTIDVGENSGNRAVNCDDAESNQPQESTVATATSSASPLATETPPADPPSSPENGLPDPEPAVFTAPEQRADEPHSPPPVSTTPGPAGSVEVVLPNIGEGIETADIAEIHVSVGDTVAKNQIVMDLETDKAVVELPSDHAGTVTQIHVSVGDTVRVGQPLLTLDAVDAPAARPVSEPPPQAASGPPRRSADRLAEPKPAETPVSKNAASSLAASTRTVSRVTEPSAPEDNPLAPVPAAPSTRRLARHLGVDLRQVTGSGPGGRITQEDVQAFVRDRLQQQLPAVKERDGVPALAAGSLAPPPLPDFSKYGPVEREKLSRLGRTAAENLSVSWNVIPHVTQHDRADITELEAARKRFAHSSATDRPKVTMTAIVMKALATCLQQFPKFNSSLDPETSEIVYKRYYHLGCAVDTPSGLLVPVVKDCDQKSIRDLAGEIAELAALARERKLPIDAMQGATCTVTNLGGIGGTAFTPVVNYPEVCILGLARGQKELQLNDGEITERLMLPLCLSYDHRVVNGADAARFMVTLCNMLSDPFQLLSAI